MKFDRLIFAVIVGSSIFLSVPAKAGYKEYMIEFADKLFEAKEYNIAMEVYTVLEDSIIDTQTMMKIGDLHYTDIGVPKDLKTTMYWYRKAADKDDSKAQFVIGYMYNNGIGVEKSEDIGTSWMNTAANNGSIEAMKIMAYHYYYGSATITKNVETAFKHAQPAANSGDAGSMYILGLYHNDPDNKHFNYPLAFQSFKKCAALDDVQCMIQLGFAYLNPDNGAGGRDIGQSRHWFTQAANRGNARAKGLLESDIINWRLQTGSSL